MKIISLKEKRAAFELSMTTVVIIVLAMTMLILGLVLIRTIFTGAKYNVESINEKVKGEINKLFTEEAQKTVVYLPNLEAKIKKGESYGVAFAIQNIDKTAAQFSYEIKAIETDCPTGTNPESWISRGKTGSFNIPSGDQSYQLTRFNIPKTASLCGARFKIAIQKTGSVYDEPFFDIQVI
ncbi:hypothetical protein COS75_03425 [Candidatus Pacearchaeota archaeon CG06_land_8_20_14_3_00_35_12]|nr:MAG: hypothetical protein COS75_03425 [Candidatus Pacearchaeota archaeon CG06_land_8_20_14_3_00_35_12]